MSVDDICKMRRNIEISPQLEPALALALCGKRFRIADDALLFLWRVSSQVEEAYKVVEMWGFEPKTEIVWVKLTKGSAMRDLYEKQIMPPLHFGMGRITRASHETCIVATRGKYTKMIKNHSTRSISRP